MSRRHRIQQHLERMQQGSANGSGQSSHPIELTEEEKAILREANQGILRLKLAVGERAIAVTEAERAQWEAEEAVRMAQGDFTDKIKAVMLAHGVNLDDPSQGKWHLDLDLLTVQKVG